MSTILLKNAMFQQYYFYIGISGILISILLNFVTQYYRENDRLRKVFGMRHGKIAGGHISRHPITCQTVRQQRSLQQCGQWIVQIDEGSPIGDVSLN